MRPALLDAALRAIDAAPEAIVAIVGPTASGKTELAVALAERLQGEIVGADSVQIYRGFDVGSGKPTAEEMARAPHHMIGTTDPLDPQDAARYAEAARRAITEIQGRGRRPIVVGGTFLWVKALLFGLAGAPPADPEIRARHREEAARLGAAALHDRLRGVDPELAGRLHPNDLLRVSRGLEVHALSGRPLSAWQGAHGFREPLHPALLLAVRHPAAALTDRIEERVAAWLDAGWVDEVRRLLEGGYAQARAMSSVGYRQVAAHVAGEISPAELRLAIVRATRVFARRQRTWLGREPVVWLESPGAD